MEQSKLNAILIAGIIVIGAGVWSGQAMTAQTLKVFLADLNNLQTLEVAFLDDQGFNFDEFNLGALKDEVFITQQDLSFAGPVLAFGGPLIDLIAFEEQLVPNDLAGSRVITPTDGTFSTPITLVEMDGATDCGFVETTVGATPVVLTLLNECQPAIVDKIFVKTPSATLSTTNFRVQVGLCETFVAAGNVNDPGGDNNPENDDCDPDATTDDFDQAVIIMDLILQPGADHTVPIIIIDAGAIPAIEGSLLMVRAASTDTANTQELRVWAGIARVGDQFAFEFTHPGAFGGISGDHCVKLNISSNAGATNNASVFMQIAGVPFFAADADDGATDGTVLFQGIPGDLFALIDVNLPTGAVFFIDQVLDTAGITVPGALNDCITINFNSDTDVPSFPGGPGV